MKNKGKGIVAVLISAVLMCGTAAFAAEPPDTGLPPSGPVSEAAVPLIAEQPEAEETSAGEMQQEASPPEEPEEQESGGEPAEEAAGQAAAEKASASFLVYLVRYDTAQGAMRICVADAAGRSVTLAAWPNGNPERVREYTQGETVRKDLEFTVPLTDFDLQEGTYTFEARLDGAPAGSVEGSMYYRHGTLEAMPTGPDESEVRLTLSGSKVPGNPRIWFVITSAETGAATLSAASSGEDGLMSTLSAQRLPAVGKYTVRAFVALPNAVPTIAETSFQVSGLSDDVLSFTNIDGSNNGTFSVQLTAQAPSGAKRAVISVWTQPDESDAREFEVAAEGTDISCAVHSRIYEYAGWFGTYHARARVELANGRWATVPETRAEIAPHNYILITGEGTSRRITLVGPDPADASSFQFLVRPSGTQDDGPVLQAQAAGDGTLYAVLSSGKVPGPGTYDVYAHANGSFYGPVPITFGSGDFMSEAERRIADGCQRVYSKVGTDLYANYMWVVNNFSYVRRYGHLVPPPGYTRAQLYAVEGLEKQRGNCYTFASTFAELAKGLGYDAWYVEAEVYGSTKGWQPHGIVLIRRNGGTYICDPELQFASSAGRNLYMQPVSSPKAKYRW